MVQVGSIKITQAELENSVIGNKAAVETNPKATSKTKDELLNQLINESLILCDSKKLKIEVTEKEAADLIKEEYEKSKKYAESENEEERKAGQECIEAYQRLIQIYSYDTIEEYIENKGVNLNRLMTLNRHKEYFLNNNQDATEEDYNEYVEGLKSQYPIKYKDKN